MPEAATPSSEIGRRIRQRVTLYCSILGPLAMQAHDFQGLVGIEDLEVAAQHLDGADNDPKIGTRHPRPVDRLEVRAQRVQQGRELQVFRSGPHR